MPTTDLLLLYMTAPFAVGLFLGIYLAGHKFVANSEHIQRVEWRGRLFKVYDVTQQQWHLDPQAYAKACAADRTATLERQERLRRGNATR